MRRTKNTDNEYIRAYAAIVEKHEDALRRIDQLERDRARWRQRAELYSSIIQHTLEYDL